MEWAQLKSKGFQCGDVILWRRCWADCHRGGKALRAEIYILQFVTALGWQDVQDCEDWANGLRCTQSSRAMRMKNQPTMIRSTWRLWWRQLHWELEDGLLPEKLSGQPQLRSKILYIVHQPLGSLKRASVWTLCEWWFTGISQQYLSSAMRDDTAPIMQSSLRNSLPEIFV